MKYLLSIVMPIMFSMVIHAQQDVIKFLGIPVDGSKTEMIRKLKAKGYQSTSLSSNILEGEFNGKEVEIHVVTNNNKVYRIMVINATPIDEQQIKIQYNILCEQFANNSKYLTLKDYTIPETEDISHEITVNNKSYDAVFFQKSEGVVTPDYSKKTVWFRISKNYIKTGYYIPIYYDNGYNEANGEDL